MIRCYKTKFFGIVIGEVEDDCIHDVLEMVYKFKGKKVIIDFFPLGYPFDIELRDFELNYIGKLFEIDLKDKNSIVDGYIREIDKINNAK